MLIHYNLKILNPDGEELKNISDSFILGTCNNEFKKELYYCFSETSDAKLGKYRVILNFYYNGTKIKSQTSNFDYFIIEEIKVDVVNEKEYYLTNLSKEKINIDFIKVKDNINFYSSFELKGLEKHKFKFDVDKIFIKYGNNFIEQIKRENCKIYERKKKLFWKNLDNEVLIYNEELKQKIILDKDESKIWRLLDGTNTYIDISRITNLDINKIESIMKKLEKNNLIQILLNKN